MRRKPVGLGLIVLVCPIGLSLAPRTAGAEDPKVVVTGGADETGNSYTWQVTNRCDSRIVRVEFPQYAADSYESPSGWRQGSQAEMNLVRVGYNYKPGVCWSVPKPENAGLGPGMTAVFTMRVSGSIGALKAPGTVTVTFADGSVVKVPGVQLPTQPAKISPWVAPIGMGLILILFIVYRERAKRKQPQSTAQTVEEDDG